MNEGIAGVTVRTGRGGSSRSWPSIHMLRLQHGVVVDATTESRDCMECSVMIGEIVCFDLL